MTRGLSCLELFYLLVHHLHLLYETEQLLCGFEAWGKHLCSPSPIDPLHLLLSGALVIPNIIKVYPDLWCWCLYSTWLDTILSELNTKTASNVKYHCLPRICLTGSHLCASKEKNPWLSIDSGSPLTTHKTCGDRNGFWYSQYDWKGGCLLCESETSQLGWWQESILHRRMICVEAAEDLLGQHMTSLAQGTFHDLF